MLYLGGYAGTGKTFLLHHLINSLGAEPICLCPTGKAASVLQKKLTNVVVRTIHSVLYVPVAPSLYDLMRLEEQLLNIPGDSKLIEMIHDEKVKLNERKITFADKDNVKIKPNDFVIIDEASMVTNKMLGDLERTGAKVLFVGDPGQLPPVGDSGFFSTQKPDIILTQVQRQALGNPIIRLSMDIRKGIDIDPFIDSEHILRRPKANFSLDNFTQCDQILTGRNTIRRKLNRITRKLLGHHESTFPVSGEKLICLKNLTHAGNMFINGVQCLSDSNTELNEASGDWELDLMYEGSFVRRAPIYNYPFDVHYHDDAIEEPWPSRIGLIELDYGYAITVHKSQGSEWDHVILVDDAMNEKDRGFRKRWLYTAVTRAKEKLTWLY
jgi:exodeoxyribonuclease-5